MPTSTLDQPVSSLVLHSGSYSNHYLFALRPGTSDTIRIDASTLFNDNNLTTVNVTAPIVGNGFGTDLNLNLGASAISLDTYFAANAVTAAKLSGTYPRSKFDIATDTNSNYVTFGATNNLDSITQPFQSFADVGANLSLVETATLTSNTPVVELLGFTEGTNCSISATATEITINGTTSANSFVLGTATAVVAGVYELDLSTGNSFDITITTENQIYFRFINFNAAIRGHLISISVNTSTLLYISFENAHLGDNENFVFETSNNTAFMGYVDSIENGVYILSQNINL